MSLNKLLGSLICLVSVCLFIWSSEKIKLDAVQLIRNPANGQVIISNNNSTASEPKVLCFLLSVLNTNRNKRRAVLDTWGRRCDKLLFVVGDYKPQGEWLSAGLIPDETDEKGALFLKVALKRRESRGELWHKVIGAVSYLYKNTDLFNEFDWFMKADDDTYLFVDELKRFLSHRSAQEPIYFGHRFKIDYTPQGYMSGGSGYVMSRRALELLVNNGIKKKLVECSLNDGYVEDVEIGNCLQAVGVKAGDSRDPLGRPTFLPLNPMTMLPGNKEDLLPWYEEYNYYSSPQLGPECCSSQPIALHYVEPETMYLIDWLVYTIRRRK